MIPITLNKDWNLITRTIVPIINQPSPAAGIRSASGLGDINPSLFFSPANSSKLLWGVGPTMTFPTETDSLLGNGRWNAGPTVVVLTTPGHWVIGALANNQWSFAGWGKKSVDALLVQPFINYNFPHGWYLVSAPIITANWEAASDERWTVTAPYVISPSNKYFYFNPDDMKPLINSEGHLRALEDYVKFLANGPSEQIGWTLEQGWSPFLSGHAVMEPTWGDLPTLAQNRAHSSVQGRVGAAIIPGTTESFNPLTSQWDKSTLNTVGNTNGGSWHCVISRLSKQKEAAYDFLAFMANKKNAFFNVTNGWTGVQPAMKYEYFPPVGTGRVEEWENQGWDKADAIAYLNAYYANLILPTQQIYLRIPGAAEYWHELDVRISSVLSGATKPKEALDDIYQAWEQITDRYGRESQKKLCAESYGEL